MKSGVNLGCQEKKPATFFAVWITTLFGNSSSYELKSATANNTDEHLKTLMNTHYRHQEILLFLAKWRIKIEAALMNHRWIRFSMQTSKFNDGYVVPSFENYWSMCRCKLKNPSWKKKIPKRRILKKKCILSTNQLKISELNILQILSLGKTTRRSTWTWKESN